MFSPRTLPDKALARSAVAFLIIALAATACGSSSSADDRVAALADASTTAPVAQASAAATIPNQGGSLEGHTPRGFQGMGTGLFAGDELNANFPPDDGVQIWLTFELPLGQLPVQEAILVSDSLTVRGNPFETLGQLQAAPVRFDAFGPSVVPLEPVGESVTCPTPTNSTFTCDVSVAVQAEIEAGRERIQLRLRFEHASDPDGEQDMAMFFLTDSNTNEPGIFRLELS